MKRIPIVSIALAMFGLQLCAQQMPRLEKNDDRHAFVVDGKPFLILGAQINNSSSWPAALKTAWPALEAMHVNTVEAPVYWEQMEPSPGQFDFSTVDLVQRIPDSALWAFGVLVVALLAVALAGRRPVSEETKDESLSTEG